MFKLSAPEAGGNVWTQTILHDFVGSQLDGSYPSAGLIFDGDGLLYGTTIAGGGGACRKGQISGCGTVFTVAP